LARQFGVGYAATTNGDSLVDRTSGFGLGETSLQTRKARRALGVGLPLIDEGLERLQAQIGDGYRERLQGPSPRPARVA
jgi:hypothetical protein